MPGPIKFFEEAKLSIFLVCIGDGPGTCADFDRAIAERPALRRHLEEARKALLRFERDIAPLLKDYEHQNDDPMKREQRGSPQGDPLS